VTCNTNVPSDWSFWGCAGIKDRVNVVITDTSNHIILPPNQFIVSGGKWYRVPYYNAPFAPELVLSVFSHPRWVSSGQQFRLWFGEDLTDDSEHNNGGRACCDVYALYA